MWPWAIPAGCIAIMFGGFTAVALQRFWEDIRDSPVYLEDVAMWIAISAFGLAGTTFFLLITFMAIGL